MEAKMLELDILLSAGLHQDALLFIETNKKYMGHEYLFYLGFVQAQLGWTEESIQALTKYKLRESDLGLLGSTGGLLADIYHNEGLLLEALEEISEAKRLDPDCPMISKKAEEIYNDLNDHFLALLIIILIMLLSKTYMKY